MIVATNNLKLIKLILTATTANNLTVNVLSLMFFIIHLNYNLSITQNRTGNYTILQLKNRFEKAVF